LESSGGGVSISSGGNFCYGHGECIVESMDQQVFFKIIFKLY